ncbi:MAG TPA: DegT/DnrJ/EryC1/StrS family aminotransferase [Planctomycetota bacterium]|nr:DegT/DnrJ/EryC1/StrS family aminotransferase [Planctomycetota bacterium]
MSLTRVTVPLLDLKAQYAPLRKELSAVVNEVFESQYFIGGPQVEGLEQELAVYTGARHAIGCTSGTDAILLALWALGVGPGDEVITSPYTFFATVGSISRLGAHCRFVDIDPATYNLDVGRLEQVITRQTKAIMPVHLYGQCVDMTALNAVAARHGIPVVEDAAQAIGSRDAGGGRAGAMGLAGCFSFFPSKNLGGAGDGGLVTTSDDKLAHKLKVMRNHGMEPKYYHALLGGNFRLDALQAAVLRVKLKHLDAWHEGRRKNAADYRKLFAQKNLGRAVTLPVERAGVYHIYNQFVIRVPAAKRDGLVKHLQSNGIGCEIYYPVPCHLQQCFAAEGWKTGDFPEAEKAAHETLALPIYPELTLEQKAAVVDAVAEFLSS